MASKLSRQLFNPKRNNMGLFFGDPIQIADSKIPGAGKGAFAKDAIEKGVVLGKYIGKECTQESDGSYVLAVEGYLNEKFVQLCVDAEDLDTSNWTRYINGIKEEGDIKNVEFFLGGTFAKPIIGIRTIKKIVKGEELLLDYGPEYW
jgi:SET domain-containing protein